MVELKLSAKALRVNSGQTQAEIAKFLNMSLTQYKRRENGTTRWYADELSRLATHYGVSISIFFDEKVS
jgi:transcriptional regulator with XRE-family HTH domain